MRFEGVIQKNALFKIIKVDVNWWLNRGEVLRLFEKITKPALFY
jgi:hypothetical protein